MLTIWGNRTSTCDGLSRRNFLRIGGLGLTGLTLADMLRLETQGAAASRAREPNAVIMIGLPGGPSQFETYDLKPDAPREIAGELRPIATSVPGFQISELFPLQAQIADKLAVVRGVDFYFDDAHSQQLIYTGYGRPFNVGTPIRGRMPRPAFGCVYSRLRGATAPSGMPSYVSMIRSTAEGDSDAEIPAYAGTVHRAFTTGGKLLEDLRLPSGMTLERMTQRREMLAAFDALRRDIDHRSQLASADAATMRAWEALATSKVRDAFDLGQEPESVRAKYGKIGNKGESGSIDPEKFLLARRLVEAGVKVVTLQVGSWDTHSGNFTYMHRWLPVLDRAIHGLVTDLHERGLDKHVAVLMWGEMGRTPRINNNPGRDHWADSGFAFFAGGAGLKMGQAVSQTDSRGERASGKRYTVQNVLATVYHVLGIDPATTLRDHSGRPQYLLDETEKIAELL
jgi:hypothetical protein